MATTINFRKLNADFTVTPATMVEYTLSDIYAMQGITEKMEFFAEGTMLREFCAKNNVYFWCGEKPLGGISMNTICNEAVDQGFTAVYVECYS